MANAKLVPEGKPPELGHIDGPASTWIPAPEPGHQSHKSESLMHHMLSQQDHKNTRFSLATQASMYTNNTNLGVGVLDLKRCKEKSTGALMGKAYRNPITGEVQIKNYGSIQDFCVADLWTRRHVTGDTDQLLEDPYLFRPIPMTTRTWISHHWFRDGKVFDNMDEDAMIRHVLSLHCIDAAVSGGRWAPIMLYVPMILFLSIAADLAAAVAAIVNLTLILFLQWIFNTPELYRWARPVTLFQRLVLLIYLIGRMGVKSGEEGAGATVTVGFVIALMICVLEILLGDGSAVSAYRLHCSYEVLRPLPNRIFVCRRKGAAHSEETVGRSEPVCEKITGIGYWEEDMALIADVKGLIVELRPMSRKDWDLIWAEKRDKEDVIHRFIGLDVYSPGAATIDALKLAIEEQQQLIAKNAVINRLNPKDDVRVHDMI